METNSEKMTPEQLMDKLKATVQAILRAVGDGDGVLVVVTTETGMRLESFNMDTEELASALDCAYDVVTGCEEVELPDGETLQ